MCSNIHIYNKFGSYAENKLRRYVLWLVNITRRIGHIRQEHVFLNALRQKEFHQIVNNAQEMHPSCINRQVWMDKPCEVPYSCSLTPPPLPPKPFALIQRSASAPSFIDVDEYWAFVRKMQ